MTQFVQLVISGLMLGCIYGLIAMGFVIVFKATNVVNFAHASIVMLGAFLVAKWHHSLGFFGAAAAAAVVCALAAAVLDFLFVRPLRTKARGDDVAGDHDDRAEHPARDRARAASSGTTCCRPARRGVRRRPTCSAPRSRRRASRRPSSRWC